MTWTNIPKPSTLAWINENAQGKEQYDQADITYDDAGVFYDGVNPSQWTAVAKPVSSVWTKVAKPVV